MSAQVLGPLSDIASGGVRKYEVGGRSVAVVRIGDDVYALGDTCSHADVSLSEGEVWVDAKELECWKHGSAFNLETGIPSTLPAIKPVPVYDVTVVDGNIVIVVDTPATAAEGAVS
jgi:3-phenylpropionate/trans-cinnamate dioxygenase ferredoxin subunit